MARWDEILTLPVQNPPSLEFSAADITWSRVEGWRETMDRLALIPFSRVNDFVRGESNNKEYPTRFHVEARRRRPPDTSCKPKVDGILEYILYWCSFGPDDHRKGGVVRPSRSYAAKRKTPAGRPNTKRGCVCHFIVKRLIAEPSVALVIYNKHRHVDKKGLPCHGPLDKKSAGTKAMFAPYISDELRLQIISLLHVGVPVETIMQRHTEMVEKQGGPTNRDGLLTHRYVRRMERKIRRTVYDLETDDAESVSEWVELHRDHVFIYEDFSDSETFLLGVQTDWQLQQMIRFGNRSLLASDSKFGTNKLKYPIYSVLVFDSEKNAIPVAWIITPSYANGEIHRWIGPLYNRVCTKDPTWQLGGFIVDDPLADVLSIREVFQCSVLISFWRVRHAWHKNLMEKCPCIEIRAVMAGRLGKALHSICSGSGDIGLFEAFLQDFVDCSDFTDYFKATWFPRLGAWITALKSLPFTTTEVSSAIESYHQLLKLRLLNESDKNLYERADWLIDKLGTKVHSYYWLDEYSEKNSFSRYCKNEWKRGLTPYRESIQIPDSDIKLEKNCVKIVCPDEERERVYTISNPGWEFALCECILSREGNLCEHVIKVTRVFREKGLAGPSLSRLSYNRALMSVLNCVPSDCLIRDHAVALSVCVRAQLSSLFGNGNNSSCSTSKSAEPVSKERERGSEGRETAATDEPANPSNNISENNPLLTNNQVACGDGYVNTNIIGPATEHGSDLQGTNPEAESTMDIDSDKKKGASEISKNDPSNINISGSDSPPTNNTSNHSCMDPEAESAMDIDPIADEREEEPMMESNNTLDHDAILGCEMLDISENGKAIISGDKTVENGGNCAGKNLRPCSLKIEAAVLGSGDVSKNFCSDEKGEGETRVRSENLSANHQSASMDVENVHAETALAS